MSSHNKKPKIDTKEMKFDAECVPEDYVGEAEKVFTKFYIDKDYNYELNKVKITTTKIRSIYSLVSEIYNVENNREGKNLTDDSKIKVKMLRVRILYEAGRDKDKNAMLCFIVEAKLINYIKSIEESKEDSREQFLTFAKYMEALVAYHKFYGGRDN